jgi:hypothetical protein
VEFLNTCYRLVNLLRTPQEIPFLSGLIQREIIYRILRGAEGTRLRAIATLGDQSHRTAKAIAWIRANYTKPLPVEHLAEIAGMGGVHAAPSFPRADRDESSSVSEATSIAGLRMGWTRRVQALRSGTKASANSIANTAVFSASHRCGIFGPFTHRALRHWSRSVIGKPCRIVFSE